MTLGNSITTFLDLRIPTSPPNKRILNMKTFITLAVVCFIAGAFAADIKLSDEQKAKVKEHFQACVAQENVSEEDAARLRSKDFADPSENMKCFATCFFEKIGALKDGQVQDDVVLQKLIPIVGEEKVKTALDKCKDVKGEGRCDNGYKIFECYHAAKVELGFCNEVVGSTYIHTLKPFSQD